MTDLIILKKKNKINAFHIYEYWQDLGYPENLIQTKIIGNGVFLH